MSSQVVLIIFVIPEGNIIVAPFSASVNQFLGLFSGPWTQKIIEKTIHQICEWGLNTTSNDFPPARLPARLDDYLPSMPGCIYPRII